MQAGDIVILKSGGPLMTIKSMENGEFVCEWFTKDGELKVAYFAPHSLEKA